MSRAGTHVPCAPCPTGTRFAGGPRSCLNIYSHPTQSEEESNLRNSHFSIQNAAKNQRSPPLQRTSPKLPPGSQPGALRRAAPRPLRSRGRRSAGQGHVDRNPGSSVVWTCGWGKGPGARPAPPRAGAADATARRVGGPGPRPTDPSVQGGAERGPRSSPGRGASRVASGGRTAARRKR